ncbi:MAG: hypothetical protein GTN76_11760, partial [Candidatus Aenigmarchaeota archaeon]|nr:hypothetical protein [Candidatus Aenigmarchaeota archaeon]
MFTKHGLLLALCPLILVLGCSRKTDEDRRKEIAFKSPDDAIVHYFDGMVKNDIRTILEACAINEVGENFKYDLFSERRGAMTFVATLSPTNYPFYTEINRASLSSRILSEVRMFCFSLLSSEQVNGISISPVDSERVNRFIREIDPGRLSNLKIERICFPVKYLENDARYLERAGKIARENGADEATERL